MHMYQYITFFMISYSIYIQQFSMLSCVQGTLTRPSGILSAHESLYRLPYHPLLFSLFIHQPLTFMCTVSNPVLSLLAPHPPPITPSLPQILNQISSHFCFGHSGSPCQLFGIRKDGQADFIIICMSLYSIYRLAY